LKFEKVFIEELKPNQQVATAFALGEKQLRVARNGNRYLTVKLLDKTGEINGRIWDRAEQYMETLPTRGAVFVRGRSDLFRDEMQLQIEEIIPLARSEVHASDFLPSCPISTDSLLDTLQAHLATIRRPHLKRLMKAFLSDAELMAKFKQAPAAKSMHHAYLGGLLEHTTSVIGLLAKVCGHYPQLDRDLLLVGGFLHDIGKIQEFCYDLTIDYSDSGRLIGHMVLGLEILQDKLKTQKSFPMDQAMLLKHLILSHHGEAEFGAVKLPMTMEALMLHFTDDMDAKMNSVDKIIATSPRKDDAWTPYQQIFGRFFFRGLFTDAGVESSAEEDDPKTRGVQLKIWNAGRGPIDNS
jgi:3'-5' exoribonuclease